MNKEAIPLVPELRFPEFKKRIGFVPKKLNALLFETKTRNFEGKYKKEDVLSVSGEHGCVNQIEYLGRSYAGASVDNYHVVETRDIVYTKSPLKSNPYGIIKENKGKAGIVSTLYAVYRTTEKADPTYLDHYFSDNFNLNSYLQPLVNKGAKNDMKVKNSDVLLGEIFVPEIDEQQKIAECLSSLDDLIKAEGEKLEGLRAHKKGLMQNLFPQEGETTPRLRFPEFEDSGEWEEKQIGEVFKVSSGGTPSRSQPKYWGNEIPWITTTEICENEISSAIQSITKIGLDNSAAKIFPKGTLLMAMYGQGQTRGRVAILGIEATTNQACAAILPSKKIINRFLFYFLMGQYDNLRNIANDGGQKNLSGEIIKNLVFFHPSLREQTRIAECLSSLDDLITAQQNKITALKEQKKGLMQGLFPKMEQSL